MRKNIKKLLNKGFTIVELLVALAIMGIILTIGSVSYSNIVGRMRVKTDVSEAASIGNAMVVRKSDLKSLKGIPLYPEIVKYDEVSLVNKYVTKSLEPQSMDAAYYFVTSIQVGDKRKIAVGIGTDSSKVTNKMYTTPGESGWAWIEDDSMPEFLASNGPSLDEEVEMPSTAPDNNPVVDGGVKPGDYVKYTPTLASYISTAQSNGNSDQEFKPSQYTDGWRVIKNSKDTVTLISATDVGKLTLGGEKGYRNSVAALNEVANAYVNKNCATSARTIGQTSSSVENITDSLSFQNPLTTFAKTPFNEEKYLSDVAAMTNAGIEIPDGYAWLASRATRSNNEYTDFGLTSVTTNEGISVEGLYRVSSTGAKEEYSGECGVRVIVTIQRGVNFTGGDGTKSKPWIIKN